jgi:uncharacterized RDD family membrane protein YckC
MASNAMPALFIITALVAGLLFASAYFPLLKLTVVLASPYRKADLRRRIYGAAVDGLVLMTCATLYWNAGASPLALAAVLYAVFRDAVAGQSLGKFVVGQVVMQVDTGQRCGAAGSIKRNLMLIVPGVNVIAMVLEARTLVTDPQGQRLGDRLAQTQVVEGAGLREVVRSAQRWWSAFLADLPQSSGRPGSLPDKTPVRSPQRVRPAA